MALMDLTAESLSRQIGETVPDLYVIIAKNSVLDMDAESIAAVLGVTADDVKEIEADSTYQKVRLLVAAEYSRSMVETQFGWDSLEQMAIANLAKRLHFMGNDPEFNLKVAAIANKAQRRMGNQKDKILDPASGGTKVSLSLTQRIVRKLQSPEVDVTEIREINVVDGSAKNPTFDDIDSLLGVSQRPRIADNLVVRTQDHEPTIEELAKLVEEKKRG